LNERVDHLYEDEDFDVSGESNADPSWGDEDLVVVARTFAYGIAMESSDENVLRQIRIEEVEANALAKTLKGTAEALAESVGVFLENSDENTFEHVRVDEVSGLAEATVDEEGSGEATSEALSAGVYLKGSKDNRFKYLDLGEISVEAEASSPEEETATEERFGVFVDENSSGNEFLNSSVFGFRNEAEGTALRFSEVREDRGYGVRNLSSDVTDLALNWWGSEDGPDYDGDDDGEVDYSGGGSKIRGPASFSPWLKTDPDADDDEAGVQLVSPLPILVSHVGPVPSTDTGNEGYLNKAIWGSNLVDVRGKVVVEHGTYSLGEEITDGLILISECGSSCKTIVDNGESADKESNQIVIDSDEVEIGDREGYSSRGFTFKEDLEVTNRVDASTVSINWNNLEGEVHNLGTGSLDARYNWWGDLDPSDDVEGEVDYRPFLPVEVCSFVEYMEKHELEDPKTAAAAKSLENAGGKKKLTSQLIAHFNVKPREADELFDEFGYGKVKRAFESSGKTYDRFLDNLGVSSI
ncbi:MAG: hypothetical protein ACOC86_05600, partial [Candidatus Bipolaricaulota bacterium]